MNQVAPAIPVATVHVAQNAVKRLIAARLIAIVWSVNQLVAIATLPMLASAIWIAV